MLIDAQVPVQGYPVWCSGQSGGLGLKRPGFESLFSHGSSLGGVEVVKPLLKYFLKALLGLVEVGPELMGQNIAGPSWFMGCKIG